MLSRARHWEHVSLTTSYWFTAYFPFAVNGQVWLPLGSLSYSITVRTKTGWNWNDLPEFIPATFVEVLFKLMEYCKVPVDFSVKRRYEFPIN